MFLPNDVIEYLDAPGRPFRILWIDPAGAQAYVYALGIPGAVPRPASLRALYAAVRERRARLLRPDPWRAVSPAATPSDSQRRRQLKAWNVVSALHHHLPALYLPRERAAMVAACSEVHGIAPASIMRCLRRYWERGQTLDALLPDYANSGARGKTREASAGVKRGRPRKDAAPGANIDDALRAVPGRGGALRGGASQVLAGSGLPPDAGRALRRRRARRHPELWPVQLLDRARRFAARRGALIVSITQ